MHTEPTPALLLQMIQQNDEKHVDAHDHLRRDIEQMNTNLDKLSMIVAKDHDSIIALSEREGQYRQMSVNRAVILAAMIGGGCQVLVMLLGWMDTLFKQLL